MIRLVSATNFSHVNNNNMMFPSWFSFLKSIRYFLNIFNNFRQNLTSHGFYFSSIQSILRSRKKVHNLIIFIGHFQFEYTIVGYQYNLQKCRYFSQKSMYTFHKKFRHVGTKTAQLWIISLAWANVLEGCFYLEIYSLTILLKFLFPKINNQ